jgi:hypothetical protein
VKPISLAPALSDSVPLSETYHFEYNQYLLLSRATIPLPRTRLVGMFWNRHQAKAP